jgi:hypothetical protein
MLDRPKPCQQKSCGRAAGSCQIDAAKNEGFLPQKWARTSVVAKLQSLHNRKVELYKKAGVPQMQCEQRADYVLDPHFPLAESLLINGPALSERRSKPRAAGPLQARVWGVDSDDHPFSFDCQLDNISASGLYLRLPRKMSFSSAISLVVRLLHGPFEGMSAAIKGTVIRNEHGPGGDTGIGVRILEHRFI